MENNLQTLQTFTVCRTCLRAINEGCECFYLDSGKANIDLTTLTLREKLMDFLPEINLCITPNAVICTNCSAAAESAYKFWKQCLKTEEIIRRFSANSDCNAFIDLNKLVQQVEVHDGVNVGSGDGQMVEETKWKALDIKPPGSLKNEHESTISEEIAGEVQDFEVLSTDSLSIKTDLLEDHFEENEYHVEKTSSETNDCKDDTFNDNVEVNVMSNVLYHTCDKCGHCASSKLALILHIKTHSSENRANRLNNSLKIWKETNTKEKPYKCSFASCKYSTKQKSALKVHVRTHRKEKPFKCEQCDFSTKFKQNLRCHVLRMHRKDEVPKNYKCNLCSFTTAYSRYLITHKRTHTGEKPYKCTKCEYWCKQTSHLKVHMRTHSENKPYKCSECEYSSRQLSHLKEHVKTHSVEKVFKCSHCPYRCSRMGLLKAHFVRTHTPKRCVHNVS